LYCNKVHQQTTPHAVCQNHTQHACGLNISQLDGLILDFFLNFK
jgi:hypothetical protein